MEFAKQAYPWAFAKTFSINFKNLINLTACFVQLFSFGARKFLACLAAGLNSGCSQWLEVLRET